MSASEVVMKRDDPNIAWGFRLTGGADLGTPFYVVKVLGRGHAEKAGLRVGDMVYAINGKYINTFTHKDAQNAILHTGNTLILNIRRGPFSGRSTPLPEYADPLMGLAPAPEIPRPKPVPLPPYEPPPVILKEPSPPESEDEEEVEETVAAFNVKINPKGRIAAIEELPVTPPSSRSQSRSRSRSRSRDRRTSTKRESSASQHHVEEGGTSGIHSGPGETFTYSKEVLTQYSTVLSASEQSDGQVSETINESFIIHGGSEHKMEDILSPEDIERDIFEEKMEEQKLTELLTGEAELLDKGIVGINFQKIIPKTGFIKESNVFKELQEECLKKEESEEEQLRKDPNKRFSTFLQTPKRPIPKAKQRVVSPLPEVTSVPLTIYPQETTKPSTQITEQQQQMQQHEETITQSFTTMSEAVNIVEEISFQEVKYTQEQDETMLRVSYDGPIITEAISSETIFDEKVRFEDEQEKNDENNYSIEEYKEQASVEQQTSQKEEKEKQFRSEFERQLDEIQKQLESIQQLPTVLQANLTALQEQLVKIVQAKATADQLEEEKAKPVSPKHDSTQPHMNWEIDVTVEENKEQVEKETEGLNLETTVENEVNVTNITETQVENVDIQDALRNELNEHFENMKNKKISQREDDELSVSKPPIIRNFPRSQAERPIVLPGGRKWYKPKDAYNEDFIAETIIHQSEVLVGSTIGLNFCKYEPPKFDAKNSAVFRLVQEMEKRCEGDPGLPIEGRPEKILAEEDYFPPISKRHFFAARLAEQSNENVEEILQDSSGQDIVSV